MSGWIALYRSLTTHWLYPVNRPFTKLEAWIDLLMMVNWETKSVAIGSKMVECQRGEIITSQLKLMKRWGWSKSKLLSYQKILQKDRMIDVKSDNEKTTIKLLNYEEYQAVIENEKIKKTDKKTAKRPQNVLQKDLKLNTTKQIEQVNNNNNTWRDDFKIYLTDCKKAYNQLYKDESFIAEQSRLNPGVNVRLSIEKGFKNFWGTEAGWKHKKKSRSTDLDWKQTIIKSITSPMNKVYYTKDEQAESTKQTKLDI
jgi:hypothetical protein